MYSGIAENYHTEIDLILCCSRTKLEPEVIEHIQTLLQGQIKWEYVIQTANLHGITQLLYKSIQKVSLSYIPETIASYLQRFCHNNLLRNFRLTHELILLMELLASQGISAIPFKGPTLACLAYNNLALRQFGDLDLLVKEQDVSKAQALLLSHGYRLGILKETQKRDLKFHSGETSFINTNSQAVIDLHWKIVPKFFPFAINLENWRSQLQPITLSGAKVLTFSLEDTLLHLCVHAAINLWSRIEWLCDIAEFIQAHESQIDWEKLTQQASAVGCERILLLNCILIRELLSVHLPTVIVQRLECDPTLQPLVALIKSFLFSSPGEPEPFGRGEGLLVFIKMRERLRHQLIHLIYVMNRSGWSTPSVRDRKAFQLPSGLSFLYYFLRPIRLLRKYGVMSRLLHSQQGCI
jgi:hypothetical protein